MKRKILSLLAIASLAFFACSSDEAETADARSGLNLLITDANSNLPLQDVNLKLLPNGQAKKTGPQGTASFSGLFGGTHILRAEKEGYAAMRGPVEVPLEGSNTELFSLYEMSATVTGSLFYIGDEGSNYRKPATGAKVRVTLPWYFDPSVVEAEVGADGRYSLPMPVIPGYTVEALEHTIEGVKYARILICSVSTCPDLSSGGVNRVGGDAGTTYSKASNVTFKLLDNDILLADSAQPIVLRFTDSIDIAKSNATGVVNGAIRVCVEGSTCNSNSEIRQPAEIAYSDGNRTVTITPFGKWSSAPVVRVLVLSGTGQQITKTIQTAIGTPPVDLSKESVKDLEVTSDPALLIGGELKLQWTKVDGADGYTIFARAKEGSNKYAQIYSENSGDNCGYQDGYPPTTNANKVTMDFNFSSCDYYWSELGLPGADLSDSVYFVVQAFNSISKTLLNGVTSVGVKFPDPPPIAGETVTLTSVSTDYDDGITVSWASLQGAKSYILYVNGTQARTIQAVAGTSTRITWGTTIGGVLFNRDNLSVGGAVFTVKAVGKVDTDVTEASNSISWPASIASKTTTLDNGTTAVTFNNVQYWVDIRINKIVDPDVLPGFGIEIFDDSDVSKLSYTCPTAWGNNRGCTDEGDNFRLQGDGGYFQISSGGYFNVIATGYGSGNTSTTKISINP